jgi:hypothetical protein
MSRPVYCEVISAEKIRLSNGLSVKLNWFKRNPNIYGKTISFLNEKIKGKEVFLKYDNIRYDNTNLHQIKTLRISYGITYFSKE